MGIDDWLFVLEPIVSVFILIFLIGLMLLFYLKFRIFLVILTIFLFSLVMGGLSIQHGTIPFSPYLQLFFIVLQTIFFILTTVESFSK